MTDRYTARALAVLLVVTAAVGVSPAAEAQDDGTARQELQTDRRGQTGMKFLSLSPDARAAGFGDAVTAQGGSSVSLFYNPAGMSYVEGNTQVTLNRIDWIADVGYNVGSIAVQPANGQYGVIGLSVESVDYGEIISTIRSDANPSGYEDVGTISPTAMAVGLGYARTITTRFSVGGHVKYAQQDLGQARVSVDDTETTEISKSTVAVDFGVIYETGFESLNFAVSVRNFSQDLTYVRDSFELPLEMRIGFAMDVLDLTPMSGSRHSAILAVDALRPRDYSENVRVGLEYEFMDLIAVRGGIQYPSDEEGVSFGAGLNPTIGDLSFGFDYAYTEFGLFGNVNRIGVNVGF